MPLQAPQTQTNQHGGSQDVEHQQIANSTVPPNKTISLGQRSLWCCSFFVVPLLIPMLIYLVKDSDVLRRICLGLFTALILIKLICFSVAMFHTRQHQTFIARRNSDDDRFSRRSFPAPTRLLHAPSHSFRAHSSILTTQHNSRHHPMSIAHSENRTIHNSTVDEPPPYHLALALPLPQEHTINIRAETPPPSYENTQLA